MFVITIENILFQFLNLLKCKFTFAYKCDIKFMSFMMKKNWNINVPWFH